MERRIPSGGRWFSRGTALEPQTLMLALLLCATLCQVSHQIYGPGSCTLPGGRGGRVPSLETFAFPSPTRPIFPTIPLPPFPRAAKLLRIKLYTQITSTPTLSPHFTATPLTVLHSLSPTAPLDGLEIFHQETELISTD